MSSATHTNQHPDAHRVAANHRDHDTGQHTGGDAPGGLQISQGGYTLAPQRTIIRPGESDLRFRILGPDGLPVTAYTPIHDKELHLIVVRRELTGWHVHPVREDDGTWSVALALPKAGTYRIFTDIAPQALGQWTPWSHWAPSPPSAGRCTHCSSAPLARRA